MFLIVVNYLKITSYIIHRRQSSEFKQKEIKTNGNIFKITTKQSFMNLTHSINKS